MEYMASQMSAYYEALEHQLNNVWDEGAAAFTAGSPQTSNPYDEASWQRREWDAAYQAEKTKETTDAS